MNGGAGDGHSLIVVVYQSWWDYEQLDLIYEDRLKESFAIF